MRISPVKVIAEAMLEKKAQGVTALDLRAVGTAITDHFVVCNADSTTAVAAITDNVITRMEEKCARKVLRMQGLENDFWIILDYGDIVVHVFLTEYRDFYRLEDLWADAKKKVYTDAPEETAPSKVKSKAAAKVRASVKKTTKIDG